MPDQTSNNQVPSINPPTDLGIPPQPTTTPLKPKTGLVVGLILLFLSAIGAAGYFGYQYWQLKQQTQNTQPTEQVQTVQPETDQTANWQSYKDSKISFKYPENWQVSMTDNSLFVAPSVRFKEITGNPGVYAAKFIPIVVNFYETSAALVKTPSRAKIISQEKVNINGINSLKYFLEISEPESGFNLGDEYIKVALQDEATFLEFLLFDKQYGFVFNQILSTFRFLGEVQNGTSETSIPGQKKYVSQSLGISFLYLEKQEDELFSVRKIDNKVYLTPENYVDDLDSGQYVEVFQKNPQTSFQETLEKMFLENYSKEDCEVTNESLYAGNNQGYPDNYEIANIDLVGQLTDTEDLFEQLKKCPSPYTKSNGISYFLMDKNHSDKFVFFSIGQYAIMADNENNKAWQDTIQFLN